jgi:tRNA-specific 2-thiouridylase
MSERVLVAMSGGVDSSVAAALLVEQGHEVVGVTMRLWGGESDTGCCSVADVDDARRVAQQLGIDHVVFNFTDDFDAAVVKPYVDAHRQGITPNPCIECNRHLKFDRLLERADMLGFDAVATGHHARVVDSAGRWELHRGVDAAKDQSYVVHMLTQEQLARTRFPVGSLTKAEVRAQAERLGLRTADKPDSQDVCFITASAGRETFLGDRISFRSAEVVDTSGRPVGSVPAVEMVTLGQRRGLGLRGGGPKRYVIDVDVEARRVQVGSADDLLTSGVQVGSMTWVDTGVSVGDELLAQCSAHGARRRVIVRSIDDGRSVVLEWARPEPAVAPGQSVVLYSDDDRQVIGGGLLVASITPAHRR